MDDITFNPRLCSFFEFADLNTPPVTQVYPFEPLEIQQDQPPVDSNKILFTSLLGPRTSSEAGLQDENLHPLLQEKDIAFLTAADTEHQPPLQEKDIAFLTTTDTEHQPPYSAESLQLLEENSIRRTNTALGKKNSACILKKAHPELYDAIQKRKLDVLAQRVNELTQNNNYLTLALHSAIKKRWAKGVALLLEYGADPNSIDPNTGSSAINCHKHAISCTEIFHQLRLKQANLMHIDSKGRSVLHLAASYATPRVVKEIVQAVPNLLNHKDNNQNSPIDCARKTKRMVVIRYLSECMPPKSSTDQVQTNLADLFAENLHPQEEDSSFSRRTDTTLVLVKSSLVLKDAHLEIYNAIKNKNLEVLIERINEITLNNNYLTVALHLAIKECWTKGVTLLLEKGADPNSIDPNTGSSATSCHKHAACITKIFRQLRLKQANLMHINKDGQSILHYAAGYAALKVVKEIVQAAPSLLYYRDNYRNSPLDYARIKNRKAVIGFLSECMSLNLQPE